MLNKGFDQIRQYGASSVAVSIRILAALETIAESCSRESDRQAALAQAEQVLEGCRKQDYTTGDIEDVEQQFDKVAAACMNEPNDTETGEEIAPVALFTAD